MRPTRTTVLLTAGLVTLLGVPAAAAAETPTSLYVNNRDGSNCSDTGAGTQAVPYCTISAAVKAVAPGQTVRIKPGRSYDEAVTIDRSGAPGKPISFVAEDEWEGQQADLGKLLTVRGASHVQFGSLFARGGVQISGSSDVGLDRIRAVRGRLDSVVVDGASKDVRIGRSDLVGVRIEGGSRGTVLSRNRITGAAQPAVAAVDAPGTVVTNNTVYGYCATALSIGGGSTGSGLFNNVVLTEVRSSYCKTDEPRNAILVAQSATAGTVADYNLVTGVPVAPVQVPYSWAGSTYPDPAAFHAATGQGGHDILTPGQDGVGPVEGSPTIDSGDPTAPGVLPSDINRTPTGDDPGVPNTGKNGGYIDRGAYETDDGLSQTWLHVDQTWAPVGTKVEVQAVSDSRWPTEISYHIDFGDGTEPVVTRQGAGAHGLATHVYGKPGDYVIGVTAVNGAGEKVTDRKTVKVTPATPLTAVFTDTPVLPGPADTGHLPPLTVSFDPSASATPWPVERTEVDYGEGYYERFDGLATVKHSYTRPGDHQVTVRLFDVKGNQATTTRTVRVDYARAGYVATAPFRLQDSRINHGVSLQGGVSTPVGMPIGVNPAGSASGAMSAAVINVTLTNVTQDAFLNVTPAREDRPTTSNLNARGGGTVSNTVTVPVGKDGQVWFYLNAGKADVIVDFVGYYQPGTGEKFSPVAPARLADTRTPGAGGAVAGGTTRTVKVAGVAGIPADAKAVAVNLTSTEATQNSFVVAYPDPAKRPEPASNLNPEPGKAKSNQAIVPVGPNGTITLYNHAGSAHLIVDAVGYYGKDGKALYMPVVPKRLADTRTTGKLAAGATTTVSGVPAGAVGAVVNLTATESTGAGFLTAYGFGSARPEASSLQTLPALTVPNHVTTPVADGKFTVYNGPWGGPNHVIADLLGYFTQG
ncbi:PKD domain-containing protein [Streptomyces sp. NPDC097617]|uniref:PKD domain-containing protein n=1 Tax=Streptomyces sp. NPDC097617 TaxID=3366091 RepID=UPI003821165E